MMAGEEEFAANLLNHQIQLQQVEVALLNDPDDKELLKLRDDLAEVIRLTKNLMSSEGKNVDDNPEESTSAASAESAAHSSNNVFQAGEIVMAPWSEDGQFYEAIIEDVMSDGQCLVKFNNLPNDEGKVGEVCLLSLLKPIAGKRKLRMGSTGMSGIRHQGGTKNNNNQRDQLKKKQQKKQERFQNLVEEREREKNKWQQFNQKAATRKLKGATALSKKQSIFKSPETVQGKVGVGTCGIAGKPMTNFTIADKYKRGVAASSSSTASSSSKFMHSVPKHLS